MKAINIIFLLLFSIPMHIFADGEKNDTLKEVVVVGITGLTPLHGTPIPIEIVGHEDIQGKTSSNIIDAISKRPGISQITTGTGISKPVIRGLGYNRIIVVNDGIRQEGQQWGDEHGIEIDAHTVGSVEIIKGPASLMYGSDALAGVINFQSVPQQPNGTIHADLSTEYQTNNGLFNYSLSLAGNTNGFVYGLRFSDKMTHDYKNKYDGYVYGSRFSEKALSGLIGINRSWGHSHLRLSYYNITPGIVEGERDENTGLFIKPVVIDNKTEETIVSADDGHKYGHSIPYQKVFHYKAVSSNAIYLPAGSLKATLGYQHNIRREYENVTAPNTCGLDFRLHTINYDIRYQINNNENNNGFCMAAGINGMFQNSLNKGTEFLIPSYRLFDSGAFVTAVKSLDRWNVSGGIRYDIRNMHSRHLTDDGEQRFDAFSRTFNGITGSIGTVYHANKRTHIRINIARGFRTPNINELASNGVHEGTQRFETGNKSLKPEYSWQADASADYTSDIVTAKISLFANSISNFIFLSKLSDTEGNDVIKDNVPAYMYTAGDARIMGFETEIKFCPTSRIYVENSFSYVNSIQRNRSKEEKYLPMTPAPRLLSTLHYDIIPKGSRLILNRTFAEIEMECNLRQNHYYAAYGTETATPSYTLVNISAGTDICNRNKRIATLLLSADNISDRAYQNHLSRLKYMGINNYSGRAGIYGMGRNFCIKLLIPLDIKQL